MTLRNLYYNYTGYPNYYAPGGNLGFQEVTEEGNPDLYNEQLENQKGDNKFLNFMNSSGGGGWASAIAPAATNIANAFLDTEASTADRVAGALGISALAKQWTADTTKGDKYLKGLALQNTGIKKPNYIQDASSAWGANNAIKLNAQNNISPISSESALPSLKDFKGNWWRNMGASVAQGAASGSVGGPWGALGGAVTGLFGSIGGLFGRQKRANAAYKDFLARRDTLMSARQAQFNKANIDQTLSNMQALANGNISQRINDMANIRAYGGNLYPDGGTIKEGYEETSQEPVYEGGELPEITVSAESMPWYEKVWRKFDRNVLKYPKYAYNYFFPDRNKFIVLDDNTEVNRVIDENSAFGNNYILSNEFVEKKNPNTVRPAKDFQYPNQDTLLGDKNIPLSNISTYYGIENGKLKAGKASDFEDDTFIVPNRTKNVGKIREIQLPIEGEYDWGMPWSDERDEQLRLHNEFMELNKSFVNQEKYAKELRELFDKYYGMNNSTAERAAALARQELKKNHKSEYDDYMADWNTRNNELLKKVTITEPKEGYVITENNDTLPIPNFNATPKMYFADENGNAAFVAGLKPNIEKVNDYLSKHPSYPIMVDNGRFKHITEGDDINAYTGGFMNPEDNYIIGIKQKAMGGNLYTDLSPNMMSLWNNKQQIDQQKVNMQQMNFGLGNSFNQKINRFDGGGWFDLLFGNSMQTPTPAQGVTESSYTPAVPYSTSSELRRRSYLSQQAVENARRNREADVEFWDRYRNDWGDRTPDYADMSEEEFLQESEGLHDNPNITGLPLSEYNRYKYRKYLDYPNSKTFGNAYLFRPSIDELRKKYPLEDLPVYKKGDSWYLKEGIPARNGYKNLESGGHKIRPEDFQDTIDDLRRRAWDNEFYDYRYDTGKDLPNSIQFEGNPDTYYMQDNGKYMNDKGEYWDAGNYDDIRYLMSDGRAYDPSVGNTVKQQKREQYLKYKKEQEEKAKKREEEGHVNDYWHKDIDDNFMSNPIVEHDEISVIGKKSDKTNVDEYKPTQRQIGYKKLQEDLGGSEGVKHFQEQYNAYHPESRIKVDGKVGDETVRAFQSWNNEYGSDNVYGLNKLDVDGIYGEKSQEFMSSGIAKRNLSFANGGHLNIFANRYDFGGSMNGMDLPTGMQSYENGGTHEENPYGGIQVGVDQQGNPNLVEEGEFRWGDYVFSDRINVDPTLLSRYNLAPATKHQGKKANKGKLSYADMAKKYAKKNGELANDPIGKNTLDAYMKRLQDAQEDQKFQDSMKQQKQDAIHQYRSALTTQQQGNPMYGAMKYNGMGNAATQQGVNAGMSDLGQQGSGNEVLSNTNRSGNNMLHAFGGNLFWDGGRTLNPPPYGDPESRIDYAMSYIGNPVIPNGNSRIDYANQFLQGNPPANDYGVSDFMNRIYSGNVGYGSPKVNTTVAPTQTPQNFQEWALWQHDNGNKPYVGSVNTGVEPDAFALQAQGRTANGSTANADYTTGYNGATNTNTGGSGLTGNINTGNTTTGTYATNAFKEDREGVPLYSTAGKFATFGKGFTPMLYDWMNKTNTKYDPNQRPANELVDMGNNSTFLRTADTIGGYRAPNLMDAERMNNAAQAQGLAALQSALSVGNGNRGFAAAQANQQMYNTGMGIGNNYATAQQANNEERYKTDAYNTAIDQFNANARNTSYQDNQKAEQVGQQMALSAKQAANDYLQKENWYADRTNRTAMDNRATNQAAWTDNALNYFITQAQENAERNRQNNDITKRYWSDKDGVMHYIGDSGLNGKIREYFRKNNIDNGTFTGDRLAAFNSIIQNNSAKDVANEKGELWSTVQGLMDDEIAARNKETADADKAKADELQEYRDQFDSELAQLGRYAANKDIYGNYWTSSGDLDYYGKEGFRDSQSLSQLKRAIEMLRTHNDRYNKWTPQNVTAYGGRINNGNKNNKNGYYTYTY